MPHLSLARRLQSLYYATEIKVGKFKGECFIEEMDSTKQLAAAESERDAVANIEIIFKKEVEELIEDLNKTGHKEAAKMVYKWLLDY